MSFESESSLIAYIKNSCPTEVSKGLGIGDDAGAISVEKGFLVSSVDTIVEDYHFSLSWSRPESVGIRAIETAASDIIAMACKPKAALISFGVPKNCSDMVIRGIVSGFAESLSGLSMTLYGGDIVSAHAGIFISVTVFGEALSLESIKTRSGARPGDRLYISGPTGNAAAALELLKEKKKVAEELARFHHAPRCRLDMLSLIPESCTALIDVSDGLLMDLNRIAEASKVQCVIQKDLLPVSRELQRVSGLLQRSSDCYVLSGGDDYELLCVVPEETKMHEHWLPLGYVASGEGLFLEEKGCLESISAEGFDHLLAK